MKTDARAALGGLAILPVVFLALYIWYGHPGLPPDAQTYLAAGERLNAGHSLYAPLGVGDRPVLNAATFAAPLLSPPLVAVLWRPLAAVGEWTAYAWWVIAVVVLTGTLVVLWVRAPLTTGAIVTLLSRVLAIALGVGNLDSFIAAGLVAIWYLWRGGHFSTAMWLVVFLAVLKLTPIFLVIWLLAMAPRTTWRPFLVATALFVGVGVIGAGLDAHLDYLRVLSTTANGHGSVAPIAIAFGIGIVLTSRRPAVAYGLAVLAMAAVWNPMAPLVALAAPVAWLAPVRLERESRAPAHILLE